MDINEKLQQFSQSLQDTSNKEYKQIEKEVDDEIKAGIEEEVQEYEEKKRINYEKTVQRIEKDFNKKIFNYEINCKKEIIDEGKRIKESLKLEAINRLKEFTEKEEYKDFLINSIEERNCKNRNFSGNMYWDNKGRYPKISIYYFSKIQ